MDPNALTNQLEESTKYAWEGNIEQSSQALIVQGYSLSVRQQTNVNFGDFEKLKPFESGINERLASAKVNADHYLTNLQPMIIRNIANIESYFNLNAIVPTVLPAGSTVSQWLDVLRGVQAEAIKHKETALATVNGLTSFRRSIETDISATPNGLAEIVKNLNAVVGGNNGVLAELDKDIENIQKKIDGTIAGVVLGSLAAIGGTFVIVVGSVAGFVTAGTSTPLVLGGVALLVAGSATLIGTAVGLSTALKMKRDLIMSKTSLTQEVALAQGILSGYRTLNTQASKAVTATQHMANAWTGLESSIGSVINNLENGSMADTEVLRKLFLTAANGSIATTLDQTRRIKAQMAGVETRVVEPGTIIADAILKIAS